MKKISALSAVILLVFVLAFSASAKTVKLGDVSGDGKITAADARAILRFSAKLDTYSDEQAVISDVDGNEKITAADARKVLRVSAKLDADLGEVTVGEEENTEDNTDESTTAEPSEAVEVKGGIGMTVANFIKQYGGMMRDGTSDGSVMYHNDDLIIVSDPKMIDDQKINSITVTGTKYMLNGITVNVSASSAMAKLASDGWTLKTESDSTVVYSKQSDLMKLTVKNDTVIQVELCLAFSIATEVPTETTTQEPTTNGNVTDEPTTQEPTTEPDDGKNYISTEDLPDDVRKFLSGIFGFSGVIYGTDDNGNATTTPVKLYSDGKNYNVGMSMDSVTLEILVLDEGGSDPALYIVNKTSAKYHKLNAVDQAFLGIDAQTLVGGFKVDNSGSAKIYRETVTENGAEYTVYMSTNGTNITQIYMLDGEIKRIQTVDSTGKTVSRIDIDEFYSEFSSDVFKYSQYKNVLTLLSVIS